MKFLLVAINSKYIHSNLAVYSLKAYGEARLADRSALQIELAEYTINHRTQDILADIYSREPDAIGFSCYIWNWAVIRELLAELPKLLPGADLWLGGPEVSHDAPEILCKYPQLAGIMVGEGEGTFGELAEYYGQSHSTEIACQRLQSIPGLCLPEGYTARRELLALDELPFPYDDLNAFENKIMYYESSRGCPYRCGYCLASLDRRVRLRSLELVKRELQFFLDSRVSQVKFIDRTFNCNQKHAMGIWEYIQEHDNGVTNFHFEISGELLGQEELALLNRMRPGLVQLEIGVQSANPQALEAVHRSTDLECLERNVAAVQAGENVHLHLDLIAGLPFEGLESFAASFDRVYGMHPQQLQLGFLKVLKGSEIHRKAEEYGICYQDSPPYQVLYTKWLSYRDILALKKVEEVLEIYYNSNQFTATIDFLARNFESSFDMYRRLADFLEGKDAFLKSPARARRYELLLAFAAEADPNHEMIYRELLTYDMYLRENLKSRPAFAGAVTWEDKDFIRGVYQREEQERRLLPGYEQYDWKQMSRMTHMEAFAYPVWDRELLKAQVQPPGGGGKALCRAVYKSYILFDYTRRNPLNQEAHIQVFQPSVQKVKV